MKKIICALLFVLACVSCGHTVATTDSNRAEAVGIFAVSEESATDSADVSSVDAEIWPRASFEACPTKGIKVREERFAAAAALSVLAKEKTRGCSWAQAYLSCRAFAVEAYGHELSGREASTDEARAVYRDCR